MSGEERAVKSEDLVPSLLADAKDSKLKIAGMALDRNHLLSLTSEMLSALPPDLRIRNLYIHNVL